MLRFFAYPEFLTMQSMCSFHWRAFPALLAMLTLAAGSTFAQETKLPPHETVLKGYEKVVSTADGKPSLYTLWTRKSDGNVFAELPKAFASQKTYIALTVASGERYAGLQSGEKYVQWRKYDNRIALIEPNVDFRSTGDAESKSSVNRLFTGQMMLDVPIVTTGPGGGPVIDMDQLLVYKAPVFFGNSSFHKALGRNFKLKKAKAFPENVELAFEIPNARGTLQTLHYSFSVIPDKSTYKPRVADERVGFFTTAYTDLGKYSDNETRIRYINRWHLEKADPKLELSPPKEPIIFYIEHTTPIRYRRWVKEGVESWNVAFEKVGISDAIQVYYQDAGTGAHMDKDPEDVRYNFIRWLNNDEGTAIGPSRVNPLTGQILDADIILTDGWIRYYRNQFEELLPDFVLEGFGPDTLAWLAKNPQWDPRVRLARPANREMIKSKIAAQAMQKYAGHPIASAKTDFIGDDPFDGLVGRTSQVNGMCMAGKGMGFEMAVMRMSLEILAAEAKDKAEEKKEDDKEEKKEEPKEPQLDGMPESFVGPLMAHLVAHEVGHTLGLRHNFKASSRFSLSEINSEKVKGKQQLASSVMDYIPTNVVTDKDKFQGDFTMTGVGPYDEWAIEYGYSFATDLKPILKKNTKPELAYATDEDTYGPDPLARRYDFSKNPLEYAQGQMDLARWHRSRILKEFVKDGQSWSRARRGYGLTLSLQLRSISMMGNWIGGVFVNRNHKGDEGGKAPLQVVPAEDQRKAVDFVIENSFRDEAYGLSPELLKHMTNEKWMDDFDNAIADSTWPVHEKILGYQASALTLLMNPTTLGLVYDNEFRTPDNEDALTLPELLGKVNKSIWNELDQKPGGKYSARKPMISSLRRNLQREHLKRLIDLSLPGSSDSPAYRAIGNLTRMELRGIHRKTTDFLKAHGDKLDPYTRAHLEETQQIVSKSLDANFIYNADKIGGSGGTRLIFGKETE